LIFYEKDFTGFPINGIAKKMVYGMGVLFAQTALGRSNKLLSQVFYRYPGPNYLDTDAQQ
jgi:hypothetical protein